ncbi:ComEA family DNA-binding protein [Streptomyces sp. NBC_01221]|nr:ComEA family DNA-binding protein [Streptomyces sp. NBC_01221]MCX4797567.1 ComEA family DNA-binding protein [Streptomyces sp. NBC_01242]WSP54989.1 ComEA family DNA-binding protein [Streptomyces sp. NBC_01241]WSU24270.1 ComEA family DNA-binding protein [Streptomyces sp. NBC_01108]
MAPRSHRATSGSGSGSGPGPGRARSGPGLGPGRRRPSRGRAGAVAAASRQRADALMGGAHGGRVARPALGVAVAPAPVPASALAPAPAPAPGSVSAPAPAPSPTPSPAPGRATTTTTASASASTPVSAPASTPVSAPAPGLRARVAPALRERIPVWLRLRCGLEPRTLAALSVVLIATAVFAAVHFWSARPHSVRAPDPVNEAAHAGTSEPSPGVAAAPEPLPGPPPATGSGGHIVVDVSGKVRLPGIHQLPSGARVADAIRAAGGARPGVDLAGLNRARVLMDGEQIVVGAPPGPPVMGGTGGAATGGTGTGSGGTTTGTVSLNLATVEQLDSLPGVGPVLAQRIVDYRTQHGGFRSVDELREVNGIGDRRFADLQPLVVP